MHKHIALLLPLLLLAATAPISAQAAFPLQPGEVAATCFSASLQGGGFGLAVFDLRNSGSQQTNEDWTGVPVFHHPDWTRAGFMNNEVFGIALDDQNPPNIYVTSTSSYSTDRGSGGVEFAGSGKVFKVDGTTGDVSLFNELPNSTDGEGLGNIAYDPVTAQFFVTNFHDGRIYRLDSTGALQGAPADQFDPFAPADPTSNVNGFAPLGERLWGVAVHRAERRVYFGRWVEDLHKEACGILPAAPPADPDRNQVWSVEIGATGALIGPKTLELDLPVNHANRSMPVADIAFSADGRMLVAERTMENDRCAYAHQARVLEYAGGHQSWDRTRTADGTADKEFMIGRSGTNAAGGVDYVCSLDGDTELIAATGDDLKFCSGGQCSEKIYGLQLLPPEGGDPEDSVLVDLDRDITQNDKTLIGDVEAYDLCDEPCLEILLEDVLCATDGSGDFIYRFRIRNTSRAPAYHTYVADLPPGVSADPAYLSFDDEPGGFLAHEQTSRQREIRISGATPGERLEFRFTIHDQLLAECCAIDHSVDLPVCECAQILDEGISCTYFGGHPAFFYNFTLENLLPDTGVSYTLVAPPEDVSIRQDVLPMDPIGYGGRATKSVSFSGTGARPGEELCLLISTHDQDFEQCCSIERCVRLPSRCFYGIGDPLDYDRLGDATLLLRDGGLEVSNLGSSGEDGVRIGFEPAEGFRATWRPLDQTGPLADGASLAFGATGAVAGTGPGQGLGELRITDVGPFLEVTADYSSAGSTSHRLEVYNRGELVATVTGHTGPVARIAGWPVGCGKKKVVIDDRTTACYWPEWGDVLPIEILGGPTVLGDGLRVIAENPSADLESLDSFQIQAADVPAIVLTSAVASPDCNANGTADDEDVAAGSSADVNVNFVPDECEDPTPGLEIVLDTGFDQVAGTALAPGAADDDWRVRVEGFEGPAKVVADPVAAWPAPLGDSRWISVQPWNGASLPGVEALTFENCFCLSAGTRAAVLDVEFVADDSAALLLNGAIIAGETGSFDDPEPGRLLYGDTVGSGLFVPGVNCLQMEVYDTGAVVTGFSLSGTLQTDGVSCDSPDAVFGSMRR